MNEVWTWVTQIAIIITTLVAGGPGVVWAVDKLKKVLKLEGKPVWWLAAGVSLVAALAGAVVDGLISVETLAPENLSGIALGVFFVSQVYYKMIERQYEKRTSDRTQMQQEPG